MTHSSASRSPATSGALPAERGALGPRRVGLFIRSVASGLGAERVSLALAEGLARRGHEVDLLVEERSGWLLDSLPAGVRVVDLLALESRVLGRVAQLRASLAIFASGPRAVGRRGDWCFRPLTRVAIRDDPPLHALSRYVRERRPDALLSILNYPNLALLLASPLLRSGCRLVVDVQNHVSEPARRLRSRWRTEDTPRLMRRLFRIADGIAVPSAGVARDVARIAALPPERVRVIPNPVFDASIEPLSRAPLDDPWLGASGPPVVLGVGKLKAQKDFATLIRAFARLRGERPARLLILGDGPERGRLAELAAQLGVADDVAFRGFVRNPYPFFRRAAVFALSSAWEGFGNVVVEALACGCPVVSTDCPSGPGEILDGGRYGRLVPVGDADALSAALADTLDSTPDVEKLRRRAARFSRDAAVDAYEGLLLG